MLNMKCINIIWFLLCFLCLTSCEVFNDVDEAYLTEDGASKKKYLKIIDTDEDDTIVFPNIGGERSITVEYSDFVSWEFSTMPEWIKITPVNGGGGKGGQEVVTITVAPNTRGEYRSAFLALRSSVPTWNYSWYFSVDQEKANLESTIKITSLSIKKGDANLLSGEAVIDPKGNEIVEAGFLYSVSSNGGCSYDEVSDFNDWTLKAVCEIVDNKISINDIKVNERFYYYNWVDVRAYIKLATGNIIYSGEPIYVSVTYPYPR